VQPACGQPDAESVVRQNLDPIGALVRKDVRRVRLCRTEHGDHPGKCGISSGTHVHRRGCQPCRVNADHLRILAAQLAKSALADAGQVIRIVNAPLRTSTSMACPAGAGPGVGSCTGMNAGMCCCKATLDRPASPLTDWPWQPLRVCSFSQRCYTLAFIEWAPAIAAMDAPGTWQAATSSALNSRV
jgi:hypothetical protein